MTKHKETNMTKTRRPQAKQGHHGQDVVQDRGMKHGTPVQDTPMAGEESGYRFRFSPEKSVEDSLIMDGSRNYAHEGARDPHARSQEQHLQDVARGGKR